MFLGEERTLFNKLSSEILLTMVIMLVSCGLCDPNFCRRSGSEPFDVESVHHSPFRDYGYFRLLVIKDFITKVRGLFTLLLFLVF